MYHLFIYFIVGVAESSLNKAPSTIFMWQLYMAIFICLRNLVLVRTFHPTLQGHGKNLVAVLKFSIFFGQFNKLHS